MRILFFISVLFACQLTWAETQYLTFVTKDAGGAIEQKDVSFKIDKKDIPLTEFFQVDAANRPPLTLLRPAGRRRYVVVYDLIMNKPEDIIAARKKTVAILEKLGRDDLVAIAGISRRQGLKFFCNFTADSDKWLLGLNAIGRQRFDGFIAGPEGNYYPAQFSTARPAVELTSDQQFLQMIQSYWSGEKKKEDYRSIMVQGFVDLAYALSTVKGRKEVILFSPGFDTKGINLNLGPAQPEKPKAETSGAAGIEEHEGLEEITRPVPGTGEEEEPVARPKKEQGIELLADLLEGVDSHFFIYGTGNENDFYKSLVARTDGVYFTKASEAQNDAQQILSSDQKYYVIGWNTAKAGSKSADPVKIDVAGRKIFAPQKWLNGKPYSQYSALEKQMHIANAIYTDQQAATENDKFWYDVLFEDDICKIPVFLQIPGSEILKPGSSKLPLDFYGYSIGPTGSVMDFYASLAELDMSNKEIHNRLERSGIKVWNVLWASKGRTTIRWVVVNAETGETLTHSEVLQVKDSELTMTSPFFPALDFDWILWPKLDSVQDKRGFQLRYPYSLESDYFVPDLSPKIKKEDKGRVLYFKIYNVSQGNQHPPLRLALIDENGNSSDIKDFALRQAPKPLDHGGLEVFWRVMAFPGVPSGRYRFEVDMTDPSKNMEVIRAVNIDLL